MNTREPEKQRAPRSDKREMILDATLDLVVERGFHDVPMSLVSKRAKASPGVIYHYYKSKDEIIATIYNRIRKIKRESLFEGYSPDLNDHDVFLLLWGNAYKFHRKYQREMLFLERYYSAGFVCAPYDEPEDPRALAILEKFKAKSEGGSLREWPKEVMEEITFGLIARLARQKAEWSSELLNELGESMLKAITWEA